MSDAPTILTEIKDGIATLTLNAPERLNALSPQMLEEGNAALDALAPLGVTHLEMPLTPSAVWSAIQSAGGK